MKYRKGLTKEIVQMKADKNTYADIARVLGVSRQSAQQMFVPLKPQMGEVADRAKGLCEACGNFDQFGHFHHKAYVFEILNDPDNILYLCISCHLKLNGRMAGVYCRNCGKEFTYNRRKRQFCDKLCQKAYNSTPHECSGCHKIFTMDSTQKIRIRRSQTGLIFCSKQCQGYYIAKYHGFGVYPDHRQRARGGHKYNLLLPELIMRHNKGESEYSICKNLNIPTGSSSYIKKLITKGR